MATPRRRRLPVLVATLAAALTAASGCTSSKPSATAPRPSTGGVASVPRVTQAPSGSPSTAADRLAVLAARATGATYAATYELHATGADASTGPVPSLVLVALAAGPDDTGGGMPGRVARVGLAGHGKIALYVVTAAGQFACGRNGAGHPVCLRVAGTSQPLPGYLDPGVQHVFLDYPGILARSVDDFVVTPEPSTTPNGRVPAGHCFRIAATAAAPPRSVAPGTYCFADSGALTAASFPSGRLVMTSVGAPPPAANITPPASATPLPSS